MSGMTQSTRPRHHSADPSEDVLLGVDTHKDVHVAAVITATGAMLDTRSFPTTREGYRQLLAWARAFGSLRRAGVECTGSYGAALTRYLQSENIAVTEANQPDKATRRRRGKTDAIDAASAAQAVLSGRATATAKTTDGPVETIRMFKMAKSSAVKSRSQAINQLKAVLVSADTALRESMTGLSNPKLIRRSLRDHPGSCGTSHAAAACQADPASHRRDQRPHHPDHSGDPGLCTEAAGPLRRRPGYRGCAADSGRRQSGAHGQRSLICRPLRCEPGRGIIRQNPAPQAQPRR